MQSMKRKGDGGESFFKRLLDRSRVGERKRRGFAATLRNRLVVGFLVAFPLVVTAFFAKFTFQLLDRWFRPFSRYVFGYQVYGAGLLLSLIGLYVLGMIAANVFGSRLLDVFERFVSRLPLLSPIYQGARQITEAIQIRDTRQFQEVVLVTFPYRGAKSIGFVTRGFQHPTLFGDQPTVLVFVPTTPNPTSGFLVAVPQSDVVSLPISVEAGVKFVISGGLITPDVLLGQPHAMQSGENKEKAGSGSRLSDGDEEV